MNNAEQKCDADGCGAVLGHKGPCFVSVPAKAPEHKPSFNETIAARRLNISPQTLARARKKGLIPFFRIGKMVRYDEECIKELKRRTRQNWEAIRDASL